MRARGQKNLKQKVHVPLRLEVRTWVIIIVLFFFADCVQYHVQRETWAGELFPPRVTPRCYSVILLRQWTGADTGSETSPLWTPSARVCCWCNVWGVVRNGLPVKIVWYFWENYREIVWGCVYLNIHGFNYNVHPWNIWENTLNVLCFNTCLLFET